MPFEPGPDLVKDGLGSAGFGQVRLISARTFDWGLIELTMGSARMLALHGFFWRGLGEHVCVCSERMLSQFWVFGAEEAQECLARFV